MLIPLVPYIHVMVSTDNALSFCFASDWSEYVGTSKLSIMEGIT